MSKVSTLTKLGYGIGDIASNIFIIATGMYLLYFMTDVLKVSPALAGTALLLPKLWDVLIDPIIGAISDKTKSRWGRRRIYLLLGAVPLGLFFFLTFITPKYQTELHTAAHIAVVFAIGCTFFSVVNIPYSSMAAEMSQDYNERISITMFRMIGASVGVLLAGGITMLLVEAGGGGAIGYRFMGLVLGSFIVVITLFSFWGTKDAVSLPAGEKMMPIKEQIRIAFKNTEFFALMLSYAMQSIGVGVLMAGLIYFIKHALYLPETATGTTFGLLFGTTILFIPVWMKLGVKLGKMKAYRIGLVVMILLLLTIYFTPASQSVLFYTQIVLLGFGFSSFQLFPFSMLPDTIEFDEMQSGLRREGIFSGVWASAQKLAYAVGPAIVGFALDLSGYLKDAVE